MTRSMTPALIVLATLCVVGCKSTTKENLRGDISPELDSTAFSADQDANRYARITDHNTRDAWEDAKRLLLLDRPTQLSPYVLP